MPEWSSPRQVPRDGPAALGPRVRVTPFTPHTGGDRPAGHGLIQLRRKPVRLTADDLTGLEKGEPGEITALQRYVRQLGHENLGAAR